MVKNIRSKRVRVKKDRIRKVRNTRVRKRRKSNRRIQKKSNKRINTKRKSMKRKSMKIYKGGAGIRLEITCSPEPPHAVSGEWNFPPWHWTDKYFTQVGKDVKEIRGFNLKSGMEHWARAWDAVLYHIKFNDINEQTIFTIIFKKPRPPPSVGEVDTKDLIVHRYVLNYNPEEGIYRELEEGGRRAYLVQKICTNCKYDGKRVM